MSHRRAKRLRTVLNVKGRAFTDTYKPFETRFVLNPLKPLQGHYVINPIRYTESSVRLQYKKHKKLHKENPLWKLPTLKQMHGSLW